MTSDREEREARARARAGRIHLHKTRLGEERDLSPVFGDDAVSLLTTLTTEAWALSGRPMPELPRAELPVRFVPRGT